MKVGDYVRTKSYGIKKINGFSSTLEEDFIDCDYDKYQRVLINKKEVVKSSPNIIDLIEKFDLVNGHLVICKMYENEKDIPTIVKCVGDYYFKEEDIKSIVTHEQFSQMEYKVGEIKCQIGVKVY